MVLAALEHAYHNYFPSTYTAQIILSLVAIYAVRTIARGARTSRDRTLRARTVLISSPFSSSVGIVLLKELASRGANVICLSEILWEPQELVVNALREETKNEDIFIEECDMAQPESIHAFATKFLKQDKSRIDAIVFTHEFAKNDRQSERDANSLGTFLLTTLLLPSLLVAPPERDIRIVNLVNPFYAAATQSPILHHFESINPQEQQNRTGLLLREGGRSLRTIICTRHLQRILDALPSAQVLKSNDGTSTIPVVSQKTQKSNIVAVSVCPGFGRTEIVARFFPSSAFGTLLYLLFFPLLWLLFKPPSAAVQTILHALFLPTPFKVLAGDTDVTNSSDKKSESSQRGAKQASSNKPRFVSREEVLKPGALYRECAVVDIPITAKLPTVQLEDAGGKSDEGKNKQQAEAATLPDDREYGGEAVGRLVWESYEGGLKVWDSQSGPEKSAE